MTPAEKFALVTDMTGALHLLAGEVLAATFRAGPDDTALGQDVRALAAAFQAARDRVTGGDL